MGSGFFLAALLFSLFPFALKAEHASFYGNSYITIPLKESKTSTDIYFKFKTRLADTLIFLVAGVTDYCKVDLENGRIRVVANLGSGEAELVSHSSVQLNDFKWHEISISRKDGNLSMVVDKSRKIYTKIPGKHYELNIHYGLFVGDHKNKNNSDLFFGHIKTFRGCLSGLKYNDLSVLEMARQRQSHAIVEGITWNCAAEFEATVEQPISFVEDDAFLILPQKTKFKDFSIKMEVKTILSDSLIFYNPGTARQDFLLLEIANYSLSVTVKVNERAVKLSMPQRSVADGKWNQIGFRLSSTTIELSLNDHVEFGRNLHASLIQLSEISYIGGLEPNKKFRATQKGCGIACDVGFKGCIRSLYLMEVKTGLPDAQSSDGLVSSCAWNFPCLRHPCQEGATCLQRGLDSFQCKCPNNIDTTCVQRNYNEGYLVFSRAASLATELELLSVEPFEVLEGGSEIITTTNLHLVLDYKKYGIKDSGVVFSVQQIPEHGVVTVDGWPQKQSFSLLDVARDKVHYVHDGSEDRRDNIALSVAFSAADTFTLPVYLQGNFRFTMAVNIVPKNDAPVFDISETKMLRVVQGAKKVITSELFKTDDPDSNPSELVYRIINCEVGFFEHLRKLGTKVESFTQEDVNKKKIIFVHTSPDSTDSFITLEVSDGVEVSPVYKIRVSVTPQVWRLDRNTGLQLLHQTFQIITPYNLSYTSNVPNSEYNVLFKIIKKPVFGDVEVDRSPNIWEATKSMSVWEPTDVFLNSDLKQHKVRYRHSLGEPLFDEFQFRTALNKTQIYTFRLTFVECKLQQTSGKVLELNSVWEAAVTTKSLFFETKPTKSSASILYQVIKYPQYGYLFFSQSKYRIKCFDNFTQDDVISENIRYRLHQKAFSDVTDSAILSVKSPGCGNATANLTIKYYPSNEDKFKVQVNIQQLDVEEGMSAIIDRAHLYIYANFVSDLVFNVTTSPKNGILQTIVDDKVVRNHTKSFTVQELNDNQIFYLHDGSETSQDNFKFMALSNIDETFQYVGQLSINVHLKNDHSPIRVVDKVFQVVVGGEKLLTDKDLKYIDLDLGTPTSGIVYTCREVPNGQFFNITDLSKNITEFTQEDLDRKLILFKHKGPEFSKVRLWVTDGQFHVNGILEIQASGPFIQVEMNKRIVVEAGKSTILTQEHLYYFTNLHTSDSNVFYEISGGLSCGKIVDTKGTHLRAFTQEEVNLGHVKYLNDVPSANADEITLKIRCKDAINVAQISVLILPSSYWDPLQLKRLKKLTVEESTSALITRDNLEVIQANVPASILTYYINERPQYGYLTILSDSKNGSEIFNVQSFSQDLLNDNRVLYIQAGVNQSRDSISFNVTNGLVWLNHIHLDIIIIPERWYLGSNELIVNEGGSVKISSVNLYVETEYFRPMSVVFKMIENFKHGCLQIFKLCSKSKSFSSNNLTAGILEYFHDGTENLKDSATFMAEVGEKKSEPIQMTVIVMPVNDHAPKLVNNTGLEMWEGGTAVITNTMLAAIDNDRPKETLKYHVQSCWLGNVSLITDDKKALHYFTQEFIDNGLVIFKHHNGSQARFFFNITDGVHTTKGYFFEIATKKVQLKLLVNKPLNIFPLQKKVITRHNLFSKTSDTRTILYEIEQPPSIGRLMIKSNTREYNSVVSNFTQEDIDNESIYYEHLRPFLDLYANDSFIFSISTYLVPIIERQTFSIDVSVSSGGLDSYVQIPKISLDEGGTTSIHINLSEVVNFLEMHAGFRSPVIHISAENPHHGRVFLQNNPDSITFFTQQQLESGQVFYEHDNSDTTSDQLRFSLYLFPEYIMLCNLTVNITINPVNDQPFRLVTPAPSFSVVQGENHTITREELCTEDADTPPKDIKYDLVNGPSSGRLLLKPNLESVNHFTQADVDQKRLIYVHESAVVKDSFHLRIWDEKFKPEFIFFNILVIPVNMSIKPGLPIQVRQGTNVGFLSEQNVFVETNTDANKITYLVTKTPKHGVIFKENNKTAKFTQEDLFRNHVMYLQFDTAASNDSFTLTGQIFIGNLTFKREVQLCVVVKPFMHIHDFHVKAGRVTKLTLNYLDATPLAKLTGSNPKYIINSAPNFIQIRKIIRSSGEKRHVLDSLVKSFTHEEVLGGLVHLDVKDVEVPQKGLTDKIVFTLIANVFQPALGELKIVIVNSETNDVFTSLPAPSDPEGHEGDVLLTSSNMARDYILIVTVILAIVITTIVVIIIIKCKNMERDTHKEDMPLGPLPRPPERLLSSPVKSLGLTPPPAAPPQCKVTPLGITEFDAPSPHAGYPYGVADELPDDWSSIDNSSDQASKSIMLRRNQYWV